MKTEPLNPGDYYHIFNRGINGEQLFKQKRNYQYFLKKYEKYCTKVFDTLAYNLLGNHFHFIIQVRKDLVFQDKNGKINVLDPSKQLGMLFNSYAQSINSLYKRTGGLFESPFHRKFIADDEYLASAIFYTHSNAQHHGLVKDFRSWPYSSYHEILGNEATFVSREKVLKWFGGRKAFIEFHENAAKEKFGLREV